MVVRAGVARPILGGSGHGSGGGGGLLGSSGHGSGGVGGIPGNTPIGGSILGSYIAGIAGVNSATNDLRLIVAQVERAASVNVRQFVKVWLGMLTVAQGPQEYEDVAWYAAISAINSPGGLIGLNGELAARGMRQPLPHLVRPGFYPPLWYAKWRYYRGGGLLNNLPG
jgi:hypothetical protein